MTEGNFEAKLYSVRKSKDGMIVAFVVQPHDTAGLINLDIGAHLVLGWAEYAEKPVGIEAAGARGSVQGQVEPAGDTGLSAASTLPKKPKTPFHELPLSQQAGIRCGDAEFKGYLVWAHRIGDLPVEEYVRWYCEVKSRAELDVPGAKCREAWARLNDGYESWKIEQKYADILK